MIRCTSCNRNHRSNYMRCYRCRNIEKAKASSKERYYTQKPLGNHIGTVAAEHIVGRMRA